MIIDSYLGVQQFSISNKQKFWYNTAQSMCKYSRVRMYNIGGGHDTNNLITTTFIRTTLFQF